jgi:spermidine/putrescine transport system permease protein
MLISLIMLPMLIPALIRHRSWACCGSPGGLWYCVVIAHVVLVTAPAMAVIQLRLAQMPARSKRRPAICATEWQSLTRVVLPYSLSGIAGGWLLAFTFSFDEFIIAWFVCGFTPTLPGSIYAYIVGSADPSLNAMATIIFAVACLVLLGVELLLIPILVKGRPSKAATAAIEATA